MKVRTLLATASLALCCQCVANEWIEARQVTTIVPHEELSSMVTATGGHHFNMVVYGMTGKPLPFVPEGYPRPYPVIGAYAAQVTPTPPPPDLSSATMVNQAIRADIILNADGSSSVVPIPSVEPQKALVKLATALCLLPASPTSQQAVLCKDWVFRDAMQKQVWPRVP